ncbi:hypothetical protein Agabi119p4_2444 [Agaricus bisporus var. burnettii]|uniref:DUF6729 domain-containing protein n=1 Tax=Agaricus bisporus var. burnettii TaxID=192524 RepID=A0A8H7F978_AGABI|nr:hypothetical protein Agabi119p4_2444 [Agaricus bisporus var. burnettii]
MASNSTNGRDQNNGPQSRSQDYDGSQVHVQNKPIGSAESLSCSEPSTSLPRCRGRPRVKPLTYGPKNKCGRPRKDTNEVSQQRPRKKAREHSPGVTISFGKFTLPPGFRLQNVTRLSGSKSKPREEPAEQSQQQQPAESTVNGIPPPPAPQYPHHILVEEEDPNREVDDLNDEDLEVDGIGIGVDEGIYGNEDNIGDDDTDDTGGVALEDREENIHRPSCIPCWPLPRWLMEPFEAAIEESKRRDNHGLPPLYQKSTFWFPTPAPYFLFRLCAHVLPQTLYNPRLFLWDPLALYRIPCPRCKLPLNRHSHIRHPRRCVDLNTTFWIIGYRYRCRHCTNPRTGRQTITYRSWDPRIMESLPPELAAEFPACLSYRSGMSKQLFELMRSTFQNGIGSGQFADLLGVQHLLAYNDLHLQYLNHLIARQQSLDSWIGAMYTPFLPFDDLSPQGHHSYTPSSA